MKLYWFNLFFVYLIIFTSCKNNDAATQLSSETTAIDSYLAANVTDFIAVRSDGVRVVIHHFGDGPPPHTGQVVTVPLIGKLFSNGSIFANDTIKDNLENINVAGLRNSIASLLEGTIATLYVPSAQGYGTSGTTNVPANSTLVYEVTLSGITKTSAEQKQFDSDTSFIHQFILSENIQNIIALRSGIWYTMDTLGTGDSVTVYGIINFNYKGTVMSSGAVFQQASLANQNIGGLIDGLKIGIPLIKKKGVATFYIPSGLGYGTTGSTHIPVNANLTFEVKLDSVITK